MDPIFVTSDFDICWDGKKEKKKDRERERERKREREKEDEYSCFVEVFP